MMSEDIVARFPLEHRRFEALKRVVRAKLCLDGAKDGELTPAEIAVECAFWNEELAYAETELAFAEEELAAPEPRP